MRPAATLVTILVTGACGAAGVSATQTTGPDGSASWYEIKCSSDHEACLEKARSLCPNGYEVASSDGKTERVVSDAMAGAPDSGRMLARCR